MASGLAADAVPIDPAVIRAALDGRPLMWLARRSGLHYTTLHQMLRPTADGRPYMALRSSYERMRAALPTLPPPPDAATNGHGHE